MAKSEETGEAKKRKGGSEKGRSKHRSPNHPLFDLGKAVELTKKLYETDKTHKVPIGVVHDRWAYKQHSGAGNQAVAAVKSYGLVSVEGSGEKRQVAVTDVGRRIILNSPDRESLLKKAAVGPSLYNALWEIYRETGLPSDEVLSHHLIFDRNFNEDVVGSVIERFKATVEYAGLVAGDKIEGGGGGDDGENGVVESPEAPPPSRTTRVSRKQMPADTKEDVYTLTTGDIVLQWPSRILPVEAEDVDDWLDLMKRKLKRSVSDQQDEQSGTEE